MNWTRSIPFESKNRQTEIWTCHQASSKKSYRVEVVFGKPIDILSLKLNMIEDFNSKVKQIRNSRILMFKKGRLEPVAACPICNNKSNKALKIFNVYGAVYVQCHNCSHCFIDKRPTAKSLDEFYARDKQYQSTYADQRTTATRVKQVAMPKAKLAIKQFAKIYGRKPKVILDVGAGSGHFVKACRNLGIKADGVELSQNGLDFCKKNFGFELINKDFIKDWKTISGDYEIITFWGLIEHIPYPLKMLKAAVNVLKDKEGLVIATVPRWNCFSTAVQKVFFNSIVRHLDPLAHINCFTDSSLATAFITSRLDPVAAWYFGMDAYELVTQTSYLFNDNKIIKQMEQCIPEFQANLDLARLSDEIALIGKPKKNYAK